MRKFIVALSVLLLVAVVILKVANAQDPQDVKKAATETKKECCKSATAKECPMMASAKTGEAKACDHAKCHRNKADLQAQKLQSCKVQLQKPSRMLQRNVTAETAKAEPKPCCKK